MEKAKTFKQRCEALNRRMKDIPSKTQAMRIYRRAFQGGPIYRMRYGKKVYYCSECGAPIDWHGQHRCPQCHCRWTVEPQEDQKTMERLYHMELEAKGDIQVCRIYRADRRTYYGRRSQVEIWEVERIMYAPNGERVLFARGVCSSMLYYDAFSNTSPLKYRQEKKISTSALMRYNLYVYSYHISSLTKQWQYKNVPSLLANNDNSTVALRIIATSYGETLMETGQVEMFGYLVNHPDVSLTKEMRESVNICNRNRYKIEDASMWLDNWRLLRHFGYDTHSPKYVCPEDLRELHQRLVKRKIKLEQELRRQKQMEASKREQRFIATWPEHMGKILTLNLTGDNLSIRPLQDVEEFREEGEMMHHCVYVNKYWRYDRHPNTLILSAKDGKGKRLATIEYNTANNTIMQCRAACNGVPQRDKEIRNLITTHKADFDRLLKAA